MKAEISRMCATKDELMEKLMRLSDAEIFALAAKAGITEGELDGGLKGSCSACPFNDGRTEQATQGQNYGCLPTAGRLIRLKKRTGLNWACHDDESKVCAGLCHAAKEHSLNLAEGGLIKYSTWYHQGEKAALAEAAAQRR
ncbi:hypothetical protein F6X40_09415 [Paraburkholderia sp. UCT31]|uniref:hypothetical protein n=1 Tax=Paraburkholderia sp. UCT31 TaxID=2615209 RepID=UPI00165581EC|nr:hypothetical protein [Paraburkholderia sp. UCT31]MBC8737026.1 hypothetical protein [Paraburkholderia sp. UCT31]